MAMDSAIPLKVQFVPGSSLGEPSLVLMRFDRTYSLHQSYGYDCGREHVQNASALRDFVHGCTYASKTGVERGLFAKASAPRQVFLTLLYLPHTPQGGTEVHAVVLTLLTLSVGSLPD